MLKFKPKRNGGYPLHLCCAARCTEISEIIDDTKRLKPDRLPLCQKHANIRLEMNLSLEASCSCVVESKD